MSVQTKHKMTPAKKRALKHKIYKMIIGELENHLEGIDEDTLCAKLSRIPKKHIMEQIQKLLKENRVTQRKGKNGLVYRIITDKDTTAQKTLGLTEDQLAIYKAIEEVGREGIWARRLNKKVNMMGPSVQRNLKALELRKLIKSFKSVQSKHKKFYILYELEPDEKHDGDIWYDENLDFDREFVDILTSQSYKFIREKGYASSEEVQDWITTKGISKVKIKEHHMKHILDALIYDGSIETFRNPQRPGERSYKSTRIPIQPNGFTSVPCGQCPVFDVCGPSGAVTPEKCKYLTNYLDF